MKTLLFCSLLIFGLVSPLTLGRANAQFGPPGGFGRPGGVGGGAGIGFPNQPVVSPYINLLRNNNNNGFGGGFGNGINQNVLNYYGLVRPQLATQASLQVLQQQISQNEQLLAQQDGIGVAGISGHPAYFMNTGRYFQAQGAVGRGRMGGGAAGGAGGGAAGGGASGAAARPASAAK